MWQARLACSTYICERTRVSVCVLVRAYVCTPKSPKSLAPKGSDSANGLLEAGAIMCVRGVCVRVHVRRHGVTSQLQLIYGGDHDMSHVHTNAIMHARMHTPNNGKAHNTHARTHTHIHLLWGRWAECRNLKCPSLSLLVASEPASVRARLIDAAHRHRHRHQDHKVENMQHKQTHNHSPPRACSVEATTIACSLLA